MVKLSELQAAEEIRKQDMPDPEYRREYERARLATDIAVKAIQYRADYGLSQSALGRSATAASGVHTKHGVFVPLHDVRNVCGPRHDPLLSGLASPHPNLAGWDARDHAAAQRRVFPLRQDQQFLASRGQGAPARADLLTVAALAR